MTKPHIKPIENGPLAVTDPPQLRHQNGTEIETGARAFLCRCGLSKNKPFCDGTHKEGGFSSAPDHSKLRNTEITYSGEVEGQQVTVAYTPVLCSHAGECQKRAASVFKPKEKPWVQPEEGRLAEIMDVMAHCPSGALRVSVGEIDPHHLTRGECEITVEPHGPYWVKNVGLEAEFNGVGASETKYVLCRCGLSKNKPFCDGSHYDQGWRDDAD